MDPPCPGMAPPGMPPLAGDPPGMDPPGLIIAMTPGPADGTRGFSPPSTVRAAHTVGAISNEHSASATALRPVVFRDTGQIFRRASTSTMQLRRHRPITSGESKEL